MHSSKLKQTQIHVIDSWENFQKLVTGPTYRSWAFRGHERSEWSLYSTLSRRFIDFGVHKEAWAHQEDRIFRIFCRKAHLFLKHVPKKDRAFEWLSIMQNHGAPTRLLDFTWSPFVAAFFALEKAETDSAVWAVNFAKLGSARHVFPPEQELRPPPGPRTRKKYDRYFINNEVPFLAAGEPYNM
ncbi:FRG domain-containing protein, partial [Chloroflexota bacterium]